MWYLFDNFSLAQNMGTVESGDVKLSNSPFTLVRISKIPT